MGRRVYDGIRFVVGGIALNKQGFWIDRLTLSGANVADAEVRFEPGLNVISGPSDTGKTFIIQCINYMFGGSNPPKPIPEAKQYEMVELGITTYDNSSKFTLKRSLRGGDFVLEAKGKKEEVLGAKHKSGDASTLSHFLLTLSGFREPKVQTNKQGKTRSLSFRDVARLIIVDEERVIAESSPVFSGQAIHRTVETAVFRLMLSGIDDSIVFEGTDRKVAKGRLEGKKEILDTLLSRTRKEISELHLTDEEPVLRSKIATLRSSIDAAKAALLTEQSGVSVLEKDRRVAWTRMRASESRFKVLAELYVRFELLGKQYRSDLRRLEAMSEAGSRLGQMGMERCPICGASSEHQSHEHRKVEFAPESIATSCMAEAIKIQNLLNDLGETMAESKTEGEGIETEFISLKAQVDSLDHQIKERTENKIQSSIRELVDWQSQYDRILHAVELFDKAAELEKLHRELLAQGASRSAGTPVLAIASDEAEEFSKEVEFLLGAWHFPGLKRVTYSEEAQDVVISGQRRGTHGKGVRAVTHTAFALALLRYCTKQSRPHPGVVAIDSPMIVYEEPDVNNEGLPPDLKDVFYRSVEMEFRERQVIIAENEKAAPPPDIDAISNTIKFTGTSIGRRGFIP